MTPLMQRPLALSLRIASLAPYALILLAVVAATFYTFPQTDDYCTFGRLHSHSGGNPLLETWYLYKNWTGRYSSSLVVALAGWLSSVAPARLDIVYSACLTAMIAMFALACVAVSRSTSTSRRPDIALAAIIFSSAMVLMPSKLEEYLWLTGAAVYFAGVSALLYTLKALSDRCASNEAPPHRYDWPLLCLIAICVGFNEFLAIALGGYMVLLTAIGVMYGDNVKRNIKYFLVFGAAFLVTVVAPGNFARDAGITANRHDIALATTLALESFMLFKASLLDGKVGLLCLLLLAAAGAGWLRAGESAESTRRFLPLPVTLILSFPMHLWTFSFLTGEATPGRILNQAFILALAGVMLLIAWLAQRALAKRRHHALAIASGVILLAGFALISSAPFKQFAKSTRDFAPVWKYQQLERHARLLAASRKGTSIDVPPLARGDSHPPTFQGADMTADAGNWINRCVADYYSIPSVRVQQGQ